MTLDEAIKHCLDIADGQDKCADISVSEHAKERIRECANDHRQLAEWLTDYKGLRAEIIDLRLYVQMLEEYREKAKRLLKAAVEGFNFLGAWMDEHGDCTLDCSDCPLHKPGYYCRGWNKEDEALALIGEDGDTNG